MTTHYDELLHVTTLVDLLEHGFFQHNELLAVGPFYPGLQLATSCVYWLTGLPLIACQVITMIVARTALMVALFVFVRRVTRSGRAAGLAVILYGTSTTFYAYIAQYTYQAPALALLVAALYLLVLILDDPQRWSVRYLSLLTVAVAALCVTHHLTSWLLLISLFGLAAFFALGRDWRRARLTAVVCFGTFVLIVLWSLIVGPQLLDYIVPIFREGGDDLLAVVRGNEPGRTIGESQAGDRSPLWELGLMFVSILIWLAMLTPASWHVWRRGLIGSNVARYLVLGVAAAFPVLQLLRLTSSKAGEIGDRISTFVFLAMVVVASAWLAPRLVRFRRAVIPALVVLLIGGTILGAGPGWRRTPGPFIPAADNRSVDAYSLAVADWVHQYLPDGSRIAADLTFTALIPTVADVQMLTGSRMANVFMSRRIGEDQLDELISRRVDFLVVDRRLADAGPTFARLYLAPRPQRVSSADLAKFNHTPGFKRILDDGPVQIFDIRSLRGEPQTFANRQPQGLPGGHNRWQMAWLGLLLVAFGLTTFRRWRVPHTLAPHRWLMVLPAMIALGAAGIALKTWSLLGAVILTLLAGLAWWQVHPLPEREHRLDRTKSILALATIVVVIVGAAIASWACATTLLPDFKLPPPPSIVATR